MIPLYTRDDVVRSISKYRLKYPAQFDPVSEYLAASFDILSHFLGRDWLMLHAGGGKGASSYLLAGATSDMDQHKHQVRLKVLAEMLLNLQGIDGFEEKLVRVKTDSIESSVFELQAASLLHCGGVPFRFVKEKGSTGADYEFLASLGHFSVACEAKCKVEDTAFTEATLRGSLEKARKQLPKDSPSIVFVKLPEKWTATSGDGCGTVLAKFFRQTGRISTVIYLWEVWMSGPFRMAVRMDALKVEHNPNARWSLKEFGHIVRLPINSEQWLDISQIGREIPDQAIVNYPDAISLTSLDG